MLPELERLVPICWTGQLTRSLSDDPPVMEMQYLGNVRLLALVFPMTAPNAAALLLVDDPDGPAEFSQALAHHRQGDLEQAETHYRRVLAEMPHHAPAHHNLGQMTRQLGQVQSGLPHFQQALESEPHASVYWVSMIEALLESGEKALARDLLSDGRKAGLRGAEVDALTRRLAVKNPTELSKPGSAMTRLLQEAVDALAAGRNDVAVDKASRVLAKHSSIAKAWAVVGLVRLRRREAALASEAEKSAWEALPDDRDGWNLLAALSSLLGNYTSAESAYRSAMELAPKDPFLLSNYAELLCRMGRYEEAAERARQSLDINRNHHTAYWNLGTALANLDRFDEALFCYNTALKKNPGSAMLLANKAETLRRIGRHQDALDILEQLVRRPNKADLGIQLAYHLLLPVVMTSQEDILHWRARFEQGLLGLESVKAELIDPDSFPADYFLLPYHGLNDRSLMMRISRLASKLMPALCHTRIDVNRGRVSGARIRIGFCSHGFLDHPVGRFFEGYIENLDRNSFEVVLVHATGGAKSDALRDRLEHAADRVVRLEGPIEVKQHQLSALGLDVLIWPNAPERRDTYNLAHGRYAPVQVASWGIASTTGIEAIDYYVSSIQLEPTDAIEHYSEHLVLLPSLMVGMKRPDVETPVPSLAEYGLPEGVRLYMCLQAIPKLHPDFDRVLASIVDKDPQARIVMLEAKHTNFTQQVKQRWQANVPQLLERVIWLPRMPGARFRALMAHAAVLLDPVHFGSGTTLFDALVSGVPVVTWPGAFMRGRIVAGAYRQMGLIDAPVASKLDDYAALAVEWASDSKRCEHHRQIVTDRAMQCFFDNRAPIREFELFLRSALDAAGQGRRLPRGWSLVKIDSASSTAAQVESQVK